MTPQAVPGRNRLSRSRRDTTGLPFEWLAARRTEKCVFALNT